MMQNPGQGAHRFRVLLILLIYFPYSIFLYFYTSGIEGLETSTALLGISCAYFFVSFGFIAFTYTVLAYLVEQMVQERTTSLSAAMRFSLSRLPMVFVVVLLFSIAMGIGTLLLIIPGIIVGVYLIFSPQIAALRNKGMQSFQYSIELVKGQWWRVFGIYLVFGISILAFNYLWGLGTQIITPYIGFGVIFINLISYLVTFVFQISVVVFFLNLDYLKHPIETESSKHVASAEPAPLETAKEEQQPGAKEIATPGVPQNGWNWQSGWGRPERRPVVAVIAALAAAIATLILPTYLLLISGGEICPGYQVDVGMYYTKMVPLTLFAAGLGFVGVMAWPQLFGKSAKSSSRIGCGIATIAVGTVVCALFSCFLATFPEC